MSPTESPSATIEREPSFEGSRKKIARLIDSDGDGYGFAAIEIARLLRVGSDTIRKWAKEDSDRPLQEKYEKHLEDTFRPIWMLEEALDTDQITQLLNDPRVGGMLDDRFVNRTPRELMSYQHDIAGEKLEYFASELLKKVRT